MSIDLLSTAGLGLLILSAVIATLAVLRKNTKLIYASLIVFWVVFAAYFIVLPRLITQ